MVDPCLVNVLFELVESEALEKYYLWSEEKQAYAKKAAITINTGFTTDPNAKSNERYTLYFGSGIAHFNFSNIKKAHVKVGEIFKGKKAKVVDHKGNVRFCSWKNISEKKVGE